MQHNRIEWPSYILAPSLPCGKRWEEREREREKPKKDVVVLVR